MCEQCFHLRQIRSNEKLCVIKMYPVYKKKSRNFFNNKPNCNRKLKQDARFGEAF